MMDKKDFAAAMKAHVAEVLSRPFNPVKSENEKFNCLSYWYPKIVENGIRTPKTKIITLDFKQSFDLFAILDGNSNDTCKFLLDRMDEGVLEMGVPCFIRTGQTSSKHSWDHSCKIDTLSRPNIAKHIGWIVDFSGCVDLPVDVWVVREMLKTKPIFYAFDGMPIVKERRYFVRGGKVVERFPYWPHHAIQDHIDTKKYLHWSRALTISNIQPELEVKELTEAAELAMRNIPGYWSIDFLCTDNGWYCTDMALGDSSYHYGKDPNNKRPNSKKTS